MTSIIEIETVYAAAETALLIGITGQDGPDITEFSLEKGDQAYTLGAQSHVVDSFEAPL